MPKPLVNSRIIYSNYLGRVYEHDTWLDQGVKAGDTPTFASLRITGDSTLEGNLYVEGNTTILDTNVIEFEDNILLLNRLENGSGVTLNQSGLEVERGSLTNYRLVYDETYGSLRSGIIGDMQVVATREDTPLLDGVMIWNSTSKRLDSRNSINIDMSLLSTSNSTSATSGSLTIRGGLGISKDVNMNGILNIRSNSISTGITSNGLTITSNENINLTCTNVVQIPFDKRLCFGNVNQYISATTLTNDLTIAGNGNINFSLGTGKRISVPNQIPIIFSNATEKIYATDTNTMVVTSSQDIELIPGVNKKVVIPYNNTLAFGNNNQTLLADLSGNLTINAANDIFITPGNACNIRMPVDKGIKFTNTGNQLIYGDNANKLYISATSDIRLSSTTLVNIPVNVPLSFGASNTEQVKSTSNGNLILSANNSIQCNQNTQVLSTTQSTTISNGSLQVSGGVGIIKNLNIGGNVNIAGDLTISGTSFTIDTETLLVTDNLIVINNSPFNSIDGGILIKRYNDGTLNNKNYASVFFRESTDEITFAYTANESTGANIVFTDYLPLRAQSLFLMGTQGAFNCDGDGTFQKNLTAHYGITTGSINATASSYIATLSNGNLYSSNASLGSLVVSSNVLFSSTEPTSITINGGINVLNNVDITGNFNVKNTAVSTSSTTGAITLLGGMGISCTENTSSTSGGGALTVAGGASIFKDMRVGNDIYIENEAYSSSITLNKTSGSALLSKGEITILCSTNAIGVTNGGALTVYGGAHIQKDLLIGGDVSISSNTTIENALFVKDAIYYKGNGLFDVIKNTSGSSHAWYYMGTIDKTINSYAEVEFYNGVGNRTTKTSYTLKVTISIYDTNLSVTHQHIGKAEFNSTDKSNVYIYYDNVDEYHVYLRLPTSSETSMHMKYNSNNAWNYLFNGNSTLPSGLDPLWTKVYDTLQETNLQSTFGDVIVEGSQLKIADNVPIIGYNNVSTTSARKLGTAYERYQKANDVSDGELITDVPKETNSLPSQATVSESNQVKFPSSSSSSNNYYNGWWIKITSGTNSGQVRKIIGYNGPQRVATLETSWTSQNPTEGDGYSLYNKSMYTAVFENNVLKFGYATVDSNNVNYQEDIQTIHKSILITDTSPSANATTGSLFIAGGISIQNTTNSTSSTQGGSLTSLGGMGINKTLIVGDSIGIGTFPQSDFHIKKTSPQIQLQNHQNEISRIKFVESVTNNEFKLTADFSNEMKLFSIVTSAGNTLNITLDGHVGINTTNNINNDLTMKSESIISSDSDNSFLQIRGSNSTNGSSLTLFGNNHISNQGHSHIKSRVTKCFTNEIERLRIDSDGKIHMYSTESSTSTNGALILSGGVTIVASSNASSITSGGALTIAGGTSISKDLYIGGDVFISGNISAPNTILTPIISFSNTENCTVTSYSNNKLVKMSSEGLLTFYVQTVPISDSVNCQFQFTVPERITNFNERFDLIINSVGYTDDTDIIPLFNVIGVGVKSTTRGLVKFQSVSTGIHYLSITARYSIT